MEDDQRIAVHEQWMRRLATRMLQQFPAVKRWEDTDDVLQEATFRLHQALADLDVESELHFHRLAALQIRRVLLDLSRKFRADSSFVANHDSRYEVVVSELADRREPLESDSLTLDDWTAFHETIQNLPRASREMFDLLWYSGLTQEKAAGLLGMTPRTVQRRWRDARILLHQTLNDPSRSPLRMIGDEQDS